MLKISERLVLSELQHLLTDLGLVKQTHTLFNRNIYKSTQVEMLTFSLPYITEISVVIRQWTWP